MSEPRPPRHRVDPRARWYWLSGGAITLVVTLAVTIVPAIIWEPIRPWFLTAAAVLGAIELLTLGLAPFIRYRVHRWEATGTAVYARTGWIGREWKVAPLSRIQSVEAKRNPLHQALGLAAVKVTTASAQGDIVIEGLDRDVADRLVAELTEATQHTVGDAT
jgi:uncharacterized protein